MNSLAIQETQILCVAQAGLKLLGSLVMLPPQPSTDLGLQVWFHRHLPPSLLSYYVCVCWGGEGRHLAMGAEIKGQICEVSCVPPLCGF